MVSRKNDKYVEGRKGKLITLLIASFVLLLSVGYTALNEELTISGESSFRVEEDIRVTGINLLETTNSSIEDYNPTYGKDGIKVGVTLPSNNSSVTYKVTVTNYGNTSMELKTIEKEIVNNNYNITFNKTLALTIGKLSSEEIEITFSNNTNTSQTINANLLFTFEKLEAMMAEGNKNAATSTFYNGTLTKDSIESITFMSTKEIPEDAVGYWDCSYKTGSNEVIAYYLNSETEGMYDLYIAADGEVYAPVNSGYLFQSFNKMVSINFNNSFNTSKVTNMSGHQGGMFYGCSSLLELDVTSFNTENVTAMGSYTGGMFRGCSKLTELDVSSFDTSKVTNMTGMFTSCSKLEELDLSNFDTRNVTAMGGVYGGMFYQCSSITDITFGENFKTDKVTNMWNMFCSCNLLKSLDLTNFNTSNVTSMQSMFDGCRTLTNLDVTSFNTKNVTNMSNMFYNCRAVTTLTFGENFITSKVTNMWRMFGQCSKLTELDLHTFTGEKVSNIKEMFSQCAALKKINLSNFNLNDGVDMSNMFFHYSSFIEELDIRSMDFEGKTITGKPGNLNSALKSTATVYVKNEYNKSYIESLKSGITVVIPPEEEVEEG